MAATAARGEQKPGLDQAESHCCSPNLDLVAEFQRCCREEERLDTPSWGVGVVGGARHQHVLLWPTSICTSCLILSPQLLSAAAERGQSLFSDRLRNTELAGRELLYSRLALSQDGSLRHVSPNIEIYMFDFFNARLNSGTQAQSTRAKRAAFAFSG